MSLSLKEPEHTELLLWYRKNAAHQNPDGNGRKGEKKVMQMLHKTYPFIREHI